MKIISICIALTLFFCVALKASHEEKDSRELTTQVATTTDGRKVILKSDGTWEYYTEKPVVKEIPAPKENPPADIVPKPEQAVTTPKPEQTIAAPKTETTIAAPKQEQTPAVPAGPPANIAIPNAAPTTQAATATLTFHAAAGTQPIAGGTFYLLKQDLNQILQAADLKSEKRLSLLNTFSMANYGASLGVERSAKTYGKAMEAIKPHIAATATSDANGNGQFPSVVPGIYYVMNASVIFLNTGSLSDRQAILWNVRMPIQAGQNAIALDEKNAVP